MQDFHQMMRPFKERVVKKKFIIIIGLNQISRDNIDIRGQAQNQLRH